MMKSNCLMLSAHLSFLHQQTWETFFFRIILASLNSDLCLDFSCSFFNWQKKASRFIHVKKTSLLRLENKKIFFFSRERVCFLLFVFFSLDLFSVGSDEPPYRSDLHLQRLARIWFVRREVICVSAEVTEPNRTDKRGRMWGKKEGSRGENRCRLKSLSFSFLSFLHHQFCLKSKNCTTNVKRIKTAEIHIQQVQTIGATDGVLSSSGCFSEWVATQESLKIVQKSKIWRKKCTWQKDGLKNKRRKTIKSTLKSNR